MLTPESGQQYALPDLSMMSDGTNTTKTATDGHKKFPRVSRRTKTTSPFPRATQKSQMNPKLSTQLWMAVCPPQLANNAQWHRRHHSSNQQPQKCPVCTHERQDGQTVTVINPSGEGDHKTVHTTLAWVPRGWHTKPRVSARVPWLQRQAASTPECPSRATTDVPPYVSSVEIIGGNWANAYQLFKLWCND